MSWYVSTFEVADGDTAWNGDTHPQVGYAENESRDAIGAGIEIARGIIRDGLAGVNGPYRVELSGHANPNGVPEEGWAADTISVRVTGAMPPKEATA